MGGGGGGERPYTPHPPSLRTHLPIPVEIPIRTPAIIMPLFDFIYCLEYNRLIVQ